MSSNAKQVAYTLDEKERALIVYKKPTKVTALLRTLLEKYYDVYESKHTAHSKQIHHYVIVDIPPTELVLPTTATVTFIRFFVEQKVFEEEAKQCKRYARYRYVNVGVTDGSFSELMSFVLFKTPYPYVFNFDHKPLPKAQKKTEFPIKKILMSAVFFLILFSFFVVLLDASSAFYLKKKNTEVARRLFALSNTLMNVPKQTLFWIPKSEYVFNTHIALGSLVEASSLLQNQNIRSVTPKTIDDLSQVLSTIETTWSQPLPSFLKSEQERILSAATEAREYIKISQEIIPHAGKILGADREKKYLFLLMNNMELRPGGGFIGSYAVMTLKDYKVKSFRIYDSYSVDGQLKTHIDPPLPIEMMGQPHWFSRDANTSPDFLTSATQVMQLINTSVGWKDFDGVFGITYSAVADMLPAFDALKIADYNETVTKDTFFQKAHYYSENKFFSGSHGKRAFLQAVGETLRVRLDEGEVNTIALIRSLKRSLDEKMIVLSFTDPQLEALVQKQFWGGSMSPTTCITTECASDYLSVIDMNIGVNKANFYIQRMVRLNSTFQQDRIDHTLTIDYKNESSGPPGGDYKNYLQLYIPSQSTVRSVTIDGVPVSDVRQTLESHYRIVGFPMSVPQGKQANVVVSYSRDTPIKKLYQLIVQKQIGSINNDFIYEVNPSMFDITQTNFPTVVRDGVFVYNTFLEKDRLLLITLKQT